MKSFVSLISVIFLAFFLSLTLQASAENENLYVSKAIADEEIKKNIIINLQYGFNNSTNCNNMMPQNWDKKSRNPYIDVITPTFTTGFFRNEFPLTIDSIPFSLHDFSSDSKTVEIPKGKPTEIKLLFFENTGPHNINEVILGTNLNAINFTSTTLDTNIILKKEPSFLVEDPDYYITYGSIREDRERSFQFPNGLGLYSLQINDPEKIFSKVTALAQRVDNKMEVTYTITFAKELDKSNLVITASDVDNNTMLCNVNKAISVIDGIKQKDLSNYEIPIWLEQIFKWEKEGKISSTELQNTVSFYKNNGTVKLN